MAGIQQERGKIQTRYVGNNVMETQGRLNLTSPDCLNPPNAFGRRSLSVMPDFRTDDCSHQAHSPRDSPGNNTRAATSSPVDLPPRD